MFWRVHTASEGRLRRGLKDWEGEAEDLRKSVGLATT